MLTDSNPKAITKQKSLYSKYNQMVIVKVNLDLDLNFVGDFKSILMVETILNTTVILKTCIYSYDEKILETRQVCSFYRKKLSIVYKFDFVENYWSAFIGGLKYLSEEQVDRAIESITMIQVDYFNQVYESVDQVPLLVLGYEFQRGDGSIELLVSS